MKVRILLVVAVCFSLSGCLYNSQAIAERTAASLRPIEPPPRHFIE